MRKLNLKKLTLSDILAAVAILISVVVLIRDCSQNAQINELTYRTNATQFRPNLKVCEKPNLIDFQLRSKMAVKDFFPRVTQDTIDTPATLRVTVSLKLTNIGNAVAHISSIVWVDTVSGEDQIRRMLLDKNARPDSLQAGSLNRYFTPMDLSTGDTTTIELKRDIEFIDRQAFTLHFLFLYENETGALFDTYYWARYQLGEIIYQPQVGMINGNPAVRIIYNRKQFREFLKFLDDHSSTKVYTQEQSENIIKYLSEHIKKDNGG